MKSMRLITAVALTVGLLNATSAFGQTQIAKLTVPGLGPNDVFGYDVATDGNLVLVGTRRGSAYLFNPFTNQQLATFNVPGHDVSVAIEGTTAVLGTRDGAHLFDISNLSNIVQRTLLPVGPKPEMFGVSVDLSGDTVIVGANGDNFAGSFTGSAYLFNRSTGAQFAKLTASDAAEIDNFGISVAIDNGLAVVGSPLGSTVYGQHKGAVYLYNADPGFVGNRQLANYAAPGVAQNPHFGYNVDIAGDLIAGSQAFGSAFLWKSNEQPAVLPSSNASKPIGESLSVSDDLVVVGLFDSNRVRLYELDGTLATTIVPTSQESEFGFSVAQGGDLLVFSSLGSPTSGAVYVYTLPTSVIPEPSAAAIVASGALALCVSRRRARQPINP